MSTRRTGLIVLAVACGLLVGAGLFTFGYAEGHAYLGNDPAACANCHVMNAQYDAWQKSSHHAFATCNDCHTPSSFVPKYLVKADNGFWHSFAFTTGVFDEPIRIKGRNLRVTENACRTCHEDVAHAMAPGAHRAASADAPDAPPPTCVRCHADVGHWTR